MLFPIQGDLLNDDDSSGALFISGNDHSRPGDSQTAITLTVADEPFFQNPQSSRLSADTARQRRKLGPAASEGSVGINGQITQSAPGRLEYEVGRAINWRRILLLIIAITIHNIPGNVLVAFHW